MPWENYIPTGRTLSPILSLFAITMQQQSACFISPDKISQNTALADRQTVLLLASKLHFKATFPRSLG